MPGGWGDIAVTDQPCENLSSVTSEPVAEASPLIVLAKLQHLGFLNALYGEVLMGPG